MKAEHRGETVSGMAPSLVLVLGDVARRMPGRTALLFVLMLLNAFTEGLSMALLYPLLTSAGIGEAGSGGAILRTFEQAFARFGLELSLGTVVAVIVVVVGIQSAIFITQSWIGVRLQSTYVYDWRAKLMASLFRAKWQFFANQRQGNLLHSLMSDTQQMGSVFNLLMQITTACVITVVFAAYAMAVSWQATVGLLIVAFALMVAGVPILRWGRATGASMVHHSAELHSMASEFIGGAKLIKATATEDDTATAFTREMRRWLHAYFWSRIQPALLRTVFEGVGLISICLFIWIGIGLMQFDAAAMLVVLALFARLYPKLSGLQQNLHVLNIAMPAVDRVRRLVREAQMSAESPSPDPLPSTISETPLELVLSDVDAGYGDVPVLHKVSLQASPGETIAVVGPSGAGKSTLVDCLLHLVDVTDGEIRVNGIPLSELPITAWRASIGYVAQDTFLFNTSILDNILWGRDRQQNSETEAEAAAKLAGAHAFIKDLPQGYDTLVGDRGVRLSGGQRQRIGLARALVARRNLLILDEATSALDTQTERDIMRTIDELHGRVTTVIVAHRLSTVRSADRIYVLEAGQIIEAGTWAELLARPDGRFAQMWALQQAG